MYGVVECRLSPAWHDCTKRTRERQWPLLVLERHLLVSSVNHCHKLRLCLIVHNLNLAKSAVHFVEHKKKAARHLVNGAMYIFALSPDKNRPKCPVTSTYALGRLYLLLLRSKLAHHRYFENIGPSQSRHKNALFDRVGQASDMKEQILASSTKFETWRATYC